MVDVRVATPDDLAVIAEINTRALREDGSSQYDATQLRFLAPRNPDPAEYRSLLEQSAFTLVVAEPDDGVRGFGCVHTEDGQIHAVFVSPAAMSEGIGTELLSTLEQRAVAAGRTELYLLSTLNAVGFYTAHGYTTEEATEIGDDPAIPVVRMTKTV